jgi:hypothetical protein
MTIAGPPQIASTSNNGRLRIVSATNNRERASSLARRSIATLAFTLSESSYARAPAISHTDCVTTKAGRCRAATCPIRAPARSFATA